MKPTIRKVRKVRRKPFAANNESRKRLESEGWTVAITETTIPHTFIKRDLYGLFDMIAMSGTRGVLFVQVTGGTSTSNFHARVAKVRQSPITGIVLSAGARIQVHSWETVKGQTERKLRVLEITPQEQPLEHLKD